MNFKKHQVADVSQTIPYLLTVATLLAHAAGEKSNGAAHLDDRGPCWRVAVQMEKSCCLFGHDLHDVEMLRS